MLPAQAAERWADAAKIELRRATEEAARLAVEKEAMLQTIARLSPGGVAELEELLAEGSASVVSGAVVLHRRGHE